MDTDSYGLPGGILGTHPDEFYGAMGRIVCVCAVLEDQVTTMRHALARAEQGRFTHEPVSAQIRAARTLASDLPITGRDAAHAFLTRTVAAFDKRNALVHSSFPAQPSGRLWGHRPSRSRTILDGRADTIDTSVDELMLFIEDLAQLVRDFSPAFALCASPRDGESV